MERDALLDALRSFLIEEVLEGDEAGLDPHTPLLQYGIINSISIAALVAFVDRRFSITVPPEKLVPENLTSLTAITDMLLELRAAGSP